MVYSYEQVRGSGAFERLVKKLPFASSLIALGSAALSGYEFHDSGPHSIADGLSLMAVSILSGFYAVMKTKKALEAALLTDPKEIDKPKKPPTTIENE